MILLMISLNRPHWCLFAFVILSFMSFSTSVVHSVFWFAAFTRILRAFDVYSLFITLFTIFTFLAAISVSILHHLASICRISVAVPIGACMIVLSAYLLTTFALAIIFSSLAPEVISSPYRYNASMHACALRSLCLA